MKALQLLLALLAFSLLTGCSGPTELDRGRPEQVPFEFGKEFTIIKGNYEYFHEYSPQNDSTLRLNAISFTDSRCPQGAQCIWEGELGVKIQAVYFEKTEDPTKVKGPIIADLNLGEKTRRGETFGGFKIELVSITESSAVLVVRQIGEAPIIDGQNNEKTWFSIEPVQCGSNPWERWIPEHMSIDGPAMPSEKEIISYWLEDEYRIKVLDYASKKAGGITCAACNCPRGDTIAVLVDSNSSAKIEELGWKAMGNIACTMEAKLCQDGSAVGREGPFCEFKECPTA
ncbi:Uncharacterised protein [uncultured archaeon]|nr:Uncharacterised protein [uncultured archaeon]